MLSQSFGASQVLVYPSPINSSEIQYYNWYEHPKEENIYIVSFEQSLLGFKSAFDQLNALLIENNIDFNGHLSDKSHFHDTITANYSYEELHNSIINKQSKIFRTWNAGEDFLTLLLNHDTYVMILGNKNSGKSD